MSDEDTIPDIYRAVPELTYAKPNEGASGGYETLGVVWVVWRGVIFGGRVDTPYTEYRTVKSAQRFGVPKVAKEIRDDPRGFLQQLSRKKPAISK